MVDDALFLRLRGIALVFFTIFFVDLAMRYGSDPYAVILIITIGVIIDGIMFLPEIVGSLRPYDPAKDIIEQPMTCPNCEAAYESPDSTFCWNCGASFGVPSDVDNARQSYLQSYREVHTRRHEEGEGSITIGECMVCKFDVKDNEEVAWCPRCGTIAHRDHFLEWLHVKHCCPVCKEHLNEDRLKALMS